MIQFKRGGYVVRLHPTTFILHDDLPYPHQGITIEGYRDEGEKWTVRWKTAGKSDSELVRSYVKKMVVAADLIDELNSYAPGEEIQRISEG